MGLKLTKDPSGEYRRTWYAIIFEHGKQTSRRLKTPLRGKIPLDDSGRFSLDLKGDTAFEKSKEAAKAELQEIIDTAKQMKAEERKSPGYAEREAYRKIVGKDFEILRIGDLARRNAERQRYKLTGDKKKDRYNRSVFDILVHFSKWCERYSKGKPAKDACVKLSDISREVVSGYYAELIGEFSWQTFRKYVFILASVFRYFMPKETENPFEKVYDDGYKGKKAPVDKTSVVHEAPTPDQIRKIWDYTRGRDDKPYLHRLAVLAACTGMRIGDCCTLTWDKVDMLNYRLTTKTAKTGKKIAVPIFDYDPESEDYHEYLGELRRELEAAIMERKKDAIYVIPQAAAIYLRDPSRINKEGKAIFARALFSEPEPEEAVIVGEEPPKKSPAEIVRIIEAATMKPEKKERLIRTYELHAKGKSYSQIAAAVGKRKGNVSEDLAIVEELTGEKIRAGNPYMGANAKPGLRKLLKKTRIDRGQGQRKACLYGWHSCRVFFVVTAIDAGIKPDDLRLIVGHATVRMVLHYYNPEELAAAEKVRAQLRRGKRKQAARTALPPPATVPALPAPALDPAVRLKKLDDLAAIGLISPEERERERERILSEI